MHSTKQIAREVGIGTEVSVAGTQPDVLPREPR